MQGAIEESAPVVGPGAPMITLRTTEYVSERFKDGWESLLGIVEHPYNFVS